MILLGPYLAACFLLIVSGIAKWFRPAPTSATLASVLPVRLGALAWAWASSVPAVRTLAVLEVAAGTVGALHPGAAEAAGVCLIYVCFVGFVMIARRRSGGSVGIGCGCFGVDQTPITYLHAIVDVGFAVSCAVVAASNPSRWLTTALGGEPAHGIPLAAAAAVMAALAGVAMTLLPLLRAARSS